MKTKNELLQMLFAKLAELKNGNSPVTERLSIELKLLYDILGEDVPEEYWDKIEAII